MNASTIPALFVLAGLLHGAAPAAVPTADTALAQLRAINHRFVGAAIDPDGTLLDALTHDDFLLTDASGVWFDRAQFIARARTRQLPHGARADDVRVRLFGRVALVHGLLVAPSANGSVIHLRTTDVYLWSGSAWRLVSAQDTALPANAPLQPIHGTAPAHAPWSGSDPSGSDDAVLVALNANYVQAFRAADVAWYDAHLSRDYLVINGDGSLRDRAAALERFAQPTFATHMASFPVDRVTVRRFDDVALIHAENDYELKDGRRGVMRYTDIWHRQGGRWLCVAAHITVHKAPAL